MPADPKPRAWQYMGADYTVHGAGFINSGDLYIARLPLTPDDVYRNLPDGTAIYIRQEGE